MKRVWALLLVAGLGCGRLTTPDGDDAGSVEMVVGASPTAIARLTTFAMNRYAIEWLLEHFDGDDPVGKVWCHSTSLSTKDDELVEVTELRLTIDGVIDCLRGDPETSLMTCLAKFHDITLFIEENGEQWENKYGLLRNCSPQRIPPFNYPERVDPKTWNPDSWELRELAMALISMSADEMRARPELMAALGLVAVGGLIVALPVSPVGPVVGLCLQSIDGCPSSPAYPPGQTPQPEGDR